MGPRMRARWKAPKLVTWNIKKASNNLAGEAIDTVRNLFGRYSRALFGKRELGFGD